MLSRTPVLTCLLLPLLASCHGAPTETPPGALPFLGEYFAYPHVGEARVIEAPPDSLVDGDGLLRLGFFRGPVLDVNLYDGAIYGTPGPGRALKKLSTLEWVGYGIVHPEVKLSLIIIDAKVVGIASFYVYDRLSGRLHTNQAISFTPAEHGVGETTWNDRSFLRREADDFDVEVEHRMAEGFQRIRIEAGPSADAPAVTADVACRLGALEPHVVSLPMPPAHYMYTQKAFMNAEGTVRVGDRTYTLDRDRDFAVMDEHKGYSPTEFSYFWGNLRTTGEEGTEIALNMGEGIGFGDESYWNENCVWLGGEMRLLGAIRFEVDPDDLMAPWRITEATGRVDLTFTPEARFRNDNDFVIVDMDYSQLSGSYSGFVTDGDDGRHVIEDAFGTAERGIITDIF